MNTFDADAFRRVLSDATLQRNLRGQLRALLELVDVRSRKVLACDYAEHVIWICEEVSRGDPRFRQMITVIRRFLDKKATIEEVATAREDFLEAAWQFREMMEWDAAVLRAASNSIYLVGRVCCQRELEALGVVIHIKYQPDTMSVAEAASLAIAKHAAGQDWASKDKTLRTAARRRGYEPSNVETRWQIRHLLDYLGMEIT